MWQVGVGLLTAVVSVRPIKKSWVFTVVLPIVTCYLYFSPKFLFETFSLYFTVLFLYPTAVKKIQIENPAFIARNKHVSHWFRRSLVVLLQWENRNRDCTLALSQKLTFKQGCEKTTWNCWTWDFFSPLGLKYWVKPSQSKSINMCPLTNSLVRKKQKCGGPPAVLSSALISRILILGLRAVTVAMVMQQHISLDGLQQWEEKHWTEPVHNCIYRWVGKLTHFWRPFVLLHLSVFSVVADLQREKQVCV